MLLVVLVKLSIVFSQLLARYFESFQPDFQLCWCFWSFVASFEFFHQIHDVDFRDALLAHRDCSNEAVESDEFLLEINCFLVPPDEFRGYFVLQLKISILMPLPMQWSRESYRVEDWNCSAIANTARSLNCTASVFLDCCIHPCEPIIVEARKVKFSDVARVVHVADEDVDILSAT